MGKDHLKRIATPKTWNILRKANPFITRPNAGAHRLEFGVSINTFIKEMAGLATTRKEVKKMLHDEEVLVDGKRRHDEKFNVGFMDVISFPKIKKHYRIIISDKGKLACIEIKDAESKVKLAKVNGKTLIKGGKTQLNFGDGRSLNIDKDDYKVGDTVLLELPQQTIKEHFSNDKGASVIIMKGKHAGQHGEIESIEGENVSIKNKDGSVLTRRNNIFVTGNKKSAITCSQ